MLRVDIRDLQRGPVRTDGRLDPDDPVFEGLELGLSGPVTVTGPAAGHRRRGVPLAGHVHGVVRGECRRCLTDVLDDVDIDVDAAVFTTDPDAADDPDFYPLPERATSVDVTDVVREELALAAQADLLLCRDDCAGLCPKCGADLNAGPCACRTAPAEPV